ncbi:MAG: hypothetical protein WC915_06155 [archaeon]|jgi:hypothetical protein
MNKKYLVFILIFGFMILGLEFVFPDSNKTNFNLTENNFTNESITNLSSEANNESLEINKTDSPQSEETNNSKEIIIPNNPINIFSDNPQILLNWVYPISDINVSQNNFFNISINISCVGGDCEEINITLDPATGTQYNFTTCGKTGTAGPSQAQCDTNYTGTSLAGLVTVSSGIQNWTVPSTGLYNITIAGAGGGGGTGTPGKGIIIQDSVNLIQGQILKILVGQKGEYYGGSSGAGGGGSFIVNATNSPILIAGGGTGSCNSATGQDGRNTTSGGGISPGINGNGGGTGGGGGGGGGLLTNGSSGNYGPGGGAFVFGALGGLTLGGFGGGGGQTNVGMNIAGGGGGYSGGSGNTESNCVNAGGGGSYNATANFKVLGTNPGSGYIKITFLGSLKGGAVSMVESTDPFYTNITNPYNVTLNRGQSEIITWYVNATGSINIPHNFFVYANQTANQNISNITNTLDIIIKDTTYPVMNIIYPLNTTYSITLRELNYSYLDKNPGDCWYSLDNGITNSTPVSAETNWTDLSSTGGSNTWTVYCNDSSGNEISNSVSFTSTIPVIGLTLLSPTTNINVTQNQFFEVRAKVSCSNNDCGQINITLDPSVDRTPRTCSQVWGASCLGSDPTTSAYSYDGCSSGTYYSGGFWVDEVTVDATTIALGETLNITCKFDCYPTSSYNNLAISYYNGTWNQIWVQNSACTDGNYSKAVVISGDVGTQKARCQIGYNGYTQTGTCFTGTYSDNDDVNFTVIPATKTGTISTLVGDTPFYTNITNPYNVTLTNGDSATISWWVNATGEVNTTHTFFVYANTTADLSVGNITSSWNVTILSNGSYVGGIDESAPTITFNSPLNNSYYSNTGLNIDLTISDPNLDSCWYDYDNRNINTSLGTGGSCADITSVVWAEGQHNLIVWANDTGGYNRSSSIRFTIDTASPYFNSIPSNASLRYGQSLIVDFDATDLVNLENYSISDNTNFTISSAGVLTNKTELAASTIYLIVITINDSANNINTTSYQVIVGAIPDTINPLITIISPTSQTYTSSPINFNISSNENLSSCLISINHW